MKLAIYMFLKSEKCMVQLVSKPQRFQGGPQVQDFYSLTWLIHRFCLKNKPPLKAFKVSYFVPEFILKMIFDGSCDLFVPLAELVTEQLVHPFCCHLTTSRIII